MTAIYKPTTAPEYCNASPAFCPALQSPCGFCLLLRIHHIRLSSTPKDTKNSRTTTVHLPVRVVLLRILH